MPYIAEISRINPSCFLFLIDQSGSMDEVMSPENVKPLERPVHVDGTTYTHSGIGKTKAQVVADVINRLLQNLIIKCAKSEGVRDYYNVGVIGYGGESTANRVGPAFIGPLAGRDLVPISEIANSPARIEERSKKVDDGAGGLVEQKVKFPIWFDGIAIGGTPMCAALLRAQSILSTWIALHSNSFPPICINITDGESTDGDPTQAVLKQIAPSLNRMVSHEEGHRNYQHPERSSKNFAAGEWAVHGQRVPGACPPPSRDLAGRNGGPAKGIPGLPIAPGLQAPPPTLPPTAAPLLNQAGLLMKILAFLKTNAKIKNSIAMNIFKSKLMLQDY